MGFVPQRLQEFYTWSTLHVTQWQAAPAGSLGLSAAQLTRVAEAVSAGQGYFEDQINALDAYRSAVTRQQPATATARQEIADAIRSIRAYAEQQANPAAVYAAAGIPAPAVPTPAAPPGQPNLFRIGLEDGAIVLSWKCSNPAGTNGTIYEVRRQPIGAPTGSWTFIGATGSKKFTDDTLPAGTPGVTYQVTAVRSTARGVPGEVNVRFGIGGGGGFNITSVTEGAPTAAGKLAA